MAAGFPSVVRAETLATPEISEVRSAVLIHVPSDGTGEFPGRCQEVSWVLSTLLWLLEWQEPYLLLTSKISTSAARVTPFLACWSFGTRSSK